MFGWIPIIGPIINGIVSCFTSFQNTQVAKYTVDGKIDVEAMEASTQLAIATETDIGVRLARDLIMFPVAVWTALITWDNIVTYEYHGLFIKIAGYPPTLEFLPYAVLTFLFGSTALVLWKR